MKKLLALVLALVMTLGLATVGANAAYKDADSINYTEAVDVMSAIGVLAGDETGFRPADTLKRSEGAKIVAYLMVGNKTAEALQGTGSKFTDVPANHWAAGYIEYLATVGVIGGVGGGKFDPDGQLTATQFAKMLLVALGYDAEIEGFGGTDWAINVQKVANTVGIFDGNRAVVGSAAVTREEAALYSFNTLLTPIVEYDSLVRVSNTDGGTVTVGNNKAQQVTTAKAADQTIFDDRAANNAYLVEFAEKYYPDLKLEGNGYTPDDFARPSRTWTNKNAEVGTYIAEADLVYTWTKKVTAKNIYDVLGKTIYDELTRTTNPTTLNVAIDGLVIVQDSVVIANGNAVDIDTYINRNNTNAVNGTGTGNGSVTQLFMDEDSNVYIATYNTWVYQAAADYNATKETLQLKAAGDTAITVDSLVLSAVDFPEIKDYKADDYLLVTAYRDHLGNTAIYTIDSVEKAELLTGKVEGFKVQSSVTINGASKDYSATTLAAGERNAQYSVGQNATVVLDKYGYIIAVDEAVVAENYVFIADIGSTSSINSKVVADAYFTDGTNAEITIKEIDGNSNKSAMVALNNAADDLQLSTTGTYIYGHDANDIGTGVVSGNKIKAGWYTFSKNSAGEYSLYSLNGKRQAVEYAGLGTIGDGNTSAIVTGDKVSFLSNTIAMNNTYYAGSDNINARTVRANDKTIFIVSYDDEIEVYTGVKNIPDVTLLGNAAAASEGRAIVFSVISTSNTYADYVFLSLEGNSNVYGSEATNLVYFLKYDGQFGTTGNDRYYTYKVLDGTSEKVVQAETQVAGADNIYSAYYKTRANKDGQYTSATVLDNDSGKYFYTAPGTDPITYSAGTLNIGGEAFTLAKDYTITVVSRAAALNKDKSAAYEATSVTAAGLAAMVKGYTVNYTVQGRSTETYVPNAAEIAELYVTINTATDASVKGITGATLKVGTAAAEAVTLYDTLAAAKAGTITSVKMGQDLVVAATATGASYKIYRSDENGTLSAIAEGTGDGQIQEAANASTGGNNTLIGGITTGAAAKYIVYAITATAADSSNVTKYFAVEGTPSTTATIDEVTVGGSAVTVYSSAALAQASPVVLDWASTGNYAVTAAVTDADDTAVIVNNDGGAALTTVAKDTEATTTIKITATAEDGTTVTNGYVAVQVKKTIAITGTFELELDNQGTGATGKGALGWKAIDLTNADTCAKADLNGSIICTVFEMKTGGWSDVGSKPITITNGTATADDDGFGNSFTAETAMKVEWELTLTNGETYSGTSYGTSGTAGA